MKDFIQFVVVKIINIEIITFNTNNIKEEINSPFLIRCNWKVRHGGLNIIVCQV